MIRRNQRAARIGTGYDQTVSWADESHGLLPFNFVATRRLGRAHRTGGGDQRLKFTTPADRIKILRDAYLKAFKEPEVIEEAKKTKLDLEVLPGTEVETQIRDVMNQPKDVIERVKKLSE